MKESTHWYAVRTSDVYGLRDRLSGKCEDIYIPEIRTAGGENRVRVRPLIPRLLFVKIEEAEAIVLEKESRKGESSLPLFWIYRFTKDSAIQAIPEKEMRLFRLLTANDSTHCEIYKKEEFKIGDKLRVKGGPFAGYEGYARRIRNNKHIVVEIEGICAIALPFIHPDLLEKI